MHIHTSHFQQDAVKSAFGTSLGFANKALTSKVPALNFTFPTHLHFTFPLLISLLLFFFPLWQEGTAPN